METRGMFAGVQIWGYHTATDTWVKLEVNADGTLTVISSLPAAQVADLKLVTVENFPAEYPLPAAQVADLKVVTVSGGVSEYTYVVYTGNQVNVAAARTTHFDIFNAAGSGKIIRVLGVYIQPTLTAVTGIGLTWDLIRTSGVGTGGTEKLPQDFDTDNPSLPAEITARGKPTGGASTDITWYSTNTSSEETVPYASLACWLNHVKAGRELVLHETQGLKIDQTTSSNVGSTNITVVFTVE